MIALAKKWAAKSCEKIGADIMSFSVDNFDDEIWRERIGEIAYAVLCAKFEIDLECQEVLLSTKDADLVYCCEKDNLWGMGLSKNDPRAADRSAWKG